MNKVLVIGEPLIRITPIAHQSLQNGVTSQLFYGGSEINVACNLSGFGMPCRVLTALPNTAIGQSFKQFLLTHGIDIKHIIHIGDRVGVYYLENGFGIRQSKVYYDRKNTSITQLKKEHINAEKLLENVSHIHVSGITLALSDTIQKWVEWLLLEAKKKGISMSLDLNWRSKLISLEDAKVLFSKFAYLMDYCFGIEPLMSDETDITMFNRHCATPQMIEQRMKKLKNRYNLKAIFHTERHYINGMQHYHAYAYTNQLYESTAYSSTILERVGSGDAFVSGALYQLLQQADIQHVLEFACASGTYKCTLQGDNMYQSVESIYTIMNGEKDVVR